MRKKVTLLDDAVKSINEHVEKINIEETVKKALEPIVERIEKIENASGVFNKVSEDSAVQKNSNDF